MSRAKNTDIAAMREKKDKDSNKALMALLALLFIGGVGLLFWPTPQNETSLSSLGSASRAIPNLPRSVEKDIDLQLKEGYNAQELQEIKTENENNASAPPLDAPSLYLNSDEKEELGINTSPGAEQQGVMDDLQESEKHARNYSPNSFIQGRLADKEFKAQYDLAYRKQFTEAFIENAKRHGYQVQLDKNLNVIGLRPIHRPQPLRLPQSVNEEQPESGGSR